jgi:hypothetical protein
MIQMSPGSRASRREATTKARTTLVAIIVRRRSQRSANTPAIGLRRIPGRVSAASDTPLAKVEPVSCRM